MELLYPISDLLSNLPLAHHNDGQCHDDDGHTDDGEVDDSGHNEYSSISLDGGQH